MNFWTSHKFFQLTLMSQNFYPSELICKGLYVSIFLFHFHSKFLRQQLFFIFPSVTVIPVSQLIYANL